MDYHVPMGDKGGFKELVRAALSKVQTPTTDIAEEIGVGRDRLYTFLSKGSLGTDAVKRVHEWLVEHGHMEETAQNPKIDTPQAPLSKAQAIDYLGRKLQQLGDGLLTSGESFDYVIDDFLGFIETTHANIEELRRIMKNRPKDAR